MTASQVDKRIQTYRTASVRLTVKDPAGKLIANAPITVRQTRHKFLFGSAPFLLDRIEQKPLESVYKNLFAQLFNYATLPFYLESYEPVEGRPQKERLTNMATWCQVNHIRTKGHPLVWFINLPRWLFDKTPEGIEQAQFSRIKREVGGFSGLIDTWDVVNEPIAMSTYDPINPATQLCQKYGRVRLLKLAFDQARRANPVATLLINDYETSKAYLKLLKDCIEAHVPFNAIGIQSHMHEGAWGAARVWEVCERFSRFGKPVHFTELSILSGKPKSEKDRKREVSGWKGTPEGEKNQAQQAREIYRVLFSHPSVEAITWWEFSDLGAWLGAPAGLLRANMTPKPAYTALLDLIKKEWWTGPLKLKTDNTGQVHFQAFLGDYVIETSAGKAQFSLDKLGDTELTVQLH